jgi:hypothetical protein
VPRIDLYIVVVLVPPDAEKPFEYYVLTHSEACDLDGRQRKVKLDGQPYKTGMEGLSWTDVNPRKGRWDKFPA